MAAHLGTSYTAVENSHTGSGPSTGAVRRLIRQARSNTKTRHTDLVTAVQEEHEAIYAAISAGDPNQAAALAEIHLSNSAKRLNIYLKE